MDSGGVYFSDEVKTELERRREELVCEYSGLRSVVGYVEETAFYNEPKQDTNKETKYGK